MELLKHLREPKKLINKVSRRKKLWTSNILNSFIREAPSPQTALDIFEGEWATKLGGGLGAYRSGNIPLFEDPKLAWGLKALGKVKGAKVLEIGPLEGAHTFMLQQSGAKEIIAVESNSRAYLKCLVVKELLNLNRAHFFCGDALAFLGQQKAVYDLVVASGVLYHLVEPIEFLELAARASQRLFLWTHYYDDKIMNGKPHFSHFAPAGNFRFRGKNYPRYRGNYGRALRSRAFWGGHQRFSYWLTKESILKVLRELGYRKVEIAFDTLETPGGPSFALVATKTARSGKNALS